MKKFITVFLALAMVFSCMALVACGGDKEEPQEKTYTITFMVGETEYKTQQVQEGKYATKPTAPTPTDATEEFAYWCSDAALTQEFSFSKTKITGNLTLYAKFTPKEAAITLRYYNGETELDSAEITSVNPAVLPTAEADKGYVFLGWSADNTATVAEYAAGATFTKTSAEAIAVESEATLYAIFKEADLKIGVWERYYLETDALADTKAAFITYMSDNSLDYAVEYRVYNDTDYHGVFDFGAAVNTDNDIQVIIGSGTNISSTGNGGGNVQVLAKAAMLAAYDPKGAGRQAAIITNDVAAIDFYMFITGQTNNQATLTFSDGVNNDPVVLSELFLNAASYTVPTKENATFIGYAYTENATEADISSTAQITYNTVKDHLAEGAVVLYPVFEDVVYDLVVYVHLSASKTTYITDKEFADLQDAFNSAHTDKKINWVSVSKVNGEKFCETAKGKADVVIGGSNIDSYPDFITLADGLKSQVDASWFENTSRHIGVVSGASENELALALYDAIKLNEPEEPETTPEG